MAKKKYYYIIHKPFKILSQFSNEGDNSGLGEVFSDLPKDVYPVGRLDLDSEGLLILTNDRSLNNKLLDPKHKHLRTYLVEVEGEPSAAAIKQLVTGVEINLKGKLYKTKPAIVEVVKTDLPERTPPVNYKKHPIRSWLQIKLTEGKKSKASSTFSSTSTFPKTGLAFTSAIAVPASTPSTPESTLRLKATPK